MSDTKLRLDRILSRYGYCTRREADTWLELGRVLVNGVPPRSADDKALVESVRVDGEPIECPHGILAVFNKPAGYVCSTDSSEGPTVFDLLPARWLHRNPPVACVGRLDKDTTGILLITDVGSLVQHWTSPKHKVTKVYEVTVDRELSDSLTATFAQGTLLLEGETKPCLPAHLELIGPCNAKLHLTEGRYHQVKRMFTSQGYTVTRLHRSKFGDFDVEEIAPGKWRLLPIEQHLK